MRAAPEVITIESTRKPLRYWRDVWQYRELFYFLAWRDISVRYKQTLIGVSWGVIRPLLSMIVFTIVFGRIARLPSPGVPYAVLVFSGLLPWMFFSTALTEASNSLIANVNMVSKIYFPRLIMPASSVIVALADFLISIVLLMVLMVVLRFTPSIRILALPLFTLMAIATSLGIGLWLSALNVKYRDFRFVVPFLVQLGIYVSPVGYSSALIASRWRLLYSLNPMVGVIDGFRWSIIGRNQALVPVDFLISLLACLFLLIGGISYFRATERSFADII